MTTKEAKQLARIAYTVAPIVIAWAIFHAEDDVGKEPENLVEEFIQKFERESLSVIGALDPTLWTSFRALSFAKDLGLAIKSLITLEEYKQTDRRTQCPETNRKVACPQGNQEPSKQRIGICLSV